MARKALTNRQDHLRRTLRNGAIALACGAVALAWTGRPLVQWGVAGTQVLVGNAPSTQPVITPTLESILASLDARSASAQGTAAQGTWTTQAELAAGQPQPVGGKSQQWVTCVNGDRWSWNKSGAAAPAFSIFGDGGKVIELPAGVRYDVMALPDHLSPDYQLAQYLLHLNLRPHQLLSSMTGLQTLGMETIDGVQCVHLRYDPSPAPLTNAPKGVTNISSSVLDLYVDPAHNAIARLVRGPLHGMRTECHVTQWSNFGTQADWPAKFSGGWVREVGGSTHDMGARVATTVQGFTPGDVNVEVKAAEQVSQLAFFSAPRDMLKSPDEYRHLLASHDPMSDQERLSAQVGLAQASFVQRDLAEGLRQWESAEGQIKDDSQRSRLTDAIGPLAAEAAWFKAKDKNLAPLAVTVIQKLQATCNNQQWRFVSPQVLFAWKTVHTTGIDADQTKIIDGPVLSRLAASGNGSTASMMIRMAAADPKLAVLINPALDQAAAVPLTADGLKGSVLATLIGGSIEAGDLQRARGYAAHIPAGDPWAAPVTDALALLSQPPDAPSGPWHAAAVKVYLELQPAPIASSQPIGSSMPTGSDPFLAGIARTVAGDGAKRLVAAYPLGNGLDVTALVAGASQAGADRYWNSVIRVLAEHTKPKVVELLAVPLARAAGKQFNQPGLECRTWLMAANRSAGMGSQNLALQLRWLDAAFAAAPDDMGRVAVIGRIAGAYAGAGQYDRANAAIDAKGKNVKDASAQKQLIELKEELALQQQAGNETLAGENELHRQAGQLAFLDQRLQQLKNRPGVTEADVQSLEKIEATVRSAMQQEQ